MLIRSIAALYLVFTLPPVFAKPPKPGKAIDVSAVFDLLKQGAQLSPQDAARLETEAKPDDPSARIKLLSYYANVTKSGDWESVRAARLAHILWLIERDPKAGFGLFQVSTGVYRIHCQGDALADPTGLERVAQAWLDQVDRYPKDSGVFDQTIRAVENCKPETAEKLLSEKHDQAGLGRLYATAILGLNGSAYATNDAGISIPELRQSVFAKRAGSILESTKDPEMLAAAASTLLATGAELWADGKLDWDYTPVGNDLLARARAEGAHTIRLATLPTTLPARGERPAQMLRIGGNVQANSLVKKVTPRYPEAAKGLRIEGTVKLNAVIGLDGSVLDLEVVSGPPELIQASVVAARQWVYKPTLLNGKPAYVLTQININFEIRQ